MLSQMNDKGMKGQSRFWVKDDYHNFARAIFGIECLVYKYLKSELKFSEIPPSFFVMRKKTWVS